MKCKYWLLILCLLFLAGCSKQKAENDDTSWEDEVLVAQDCGMDGLQCCTKGDTPCLYGQNCCVDPNDSKRNACFDECICGVEGRFCCADQKCGDGLACVQGDCVKCGQNNEACCEGDKCEGGLLCYQGKCAECGLTGNPCCDKEEACKDQGKSDVLRSECSDGICLLCGSNENRACKTEPNCIAGHLFNNDICYHCGGANQPCCDLKNSKSECSKELNLKCVLGFCSK